MRAWEETNHNVVMQMAYRNESTSRITQGDDLPSDPEIAGWLGKEACKYRKPVGWAKRLTLPDRIQMMLGCDA